MQSENGHIYHTQSGRAIAPPLAIVHRVRFSIYFNSCRWQSSYLGITVTQFSIYLSLERFLLGLLMHVADLGRPNSQVPYQHPLQAIFESPPQIAAEFRLSIWYTVISHASGHIGC